MNKGYGKVIMFGEHFVVYGLPGIVAALDSFTTAKVEPGEPGGGLSVIDNRPAVEGYKEKKKGEHDRALELIMRFMNIDLDKTPLNITLEGNLKCVGGRGASAAMATSIARALSEHFKLNLDDDKVNEISYEGEIRRPAVRNFRRPVLQRPSKRQLTAKAFQFFLWFLNKRFISHS